MDGMDNIIIMVIIKIKIQTNNKRDRMIKYHIIVTNILRIYIHITMNNNGVIYNTIILIFLITNKIQQKQAFLYNKYQKYQK